MRLRCYVVRFTLLCKGCRSPDASDKKHPIWYSHSELFQPRIGTECVPNHCIEWLKENLISKPVNVVRGHLAGEIFGVRSDVQEADVWEGFRDVVQDREEFVPTREALIHGQDEVIPRWRTRHPVETEGNVCHLYQGKMIWSKKGPLDVFKKGRAREPELICFAENLDTFCVPEACVALGKWLCKINNDQERLTHVDKSSTTPLPQHTNLQYCIPEVVGVPGESPRCASTEGTGRASLVGTLYLCVQTNGTDSSRQKADRTASPRGGCHGQRRGSESCVEFPQETSEKSRS